MSHGPWPRHPRSGCSSNQARKVLRQVGGDTWYDVQCKKCDGTWSGAVAGFVDPAQADNMVANLNGIFTTLGADLDFIHMHRYGDGQYAAVWSGVRWFNDDSQVTSLCTSTKKTYEPLYKADGVTAIKRVTSADESFYGLPPWKVAYNWVKNIKNVLNGWNCTKGAVNIPLFQSGFIIPPPSQTEWNLGSITKAGSRYGYGECQPNVTVATGAEIFHCMDFSIARPSDTSWTLNKWVKVTYAGTSAHARLIDVCGTTKVDLSRGLATYLGFPGSGNVTVSNP